MFYVACKIGIFFVLLKEKKNKLDLVFLGNRVSFCHGWNILENRPVYELGC